MKENAMGTGKHCQGWFVGSSSLESLWSFRLAGRHADENFKSLYLTSNVFQIDFGVDNIIPINN